jgi:hypothetical protein
MLYNFYAVGYNDKIMIFKLNKNYFKQSKN